MAHVRTWSMTLLLLLLCWGAVGQNMVPNGNFEAYTSCPNNDNQLSKCMGWSGFIKGTSDYFNTCGTNDVGVPKNAWGERYPASGNAYAGVYAGRKQDSTDYKEYLQRQITPLKKGTPYEVSMSVSLADISMYGANGLGVWLIQNLTVVQGSPIEPHAQIVYPGVVTNNTGWTRLSTIFLADSAYNRMVIGSFIPSLDMDTLAVGGGTLGWAYYLVDSVVIRKVSHIQLNYKGGRYCVGDTMKVPFNIYGNDFFSSNNDFNLQLSDSSGSFATSYTILTSITGTGDSTFRYVIPPGIRSSNNYRIRIVSDRNADTSVISGKVAIGNVMPLKPVASSNAPVCTGNTLYLDADNTQAGVSYEWNGPRGFHDTNIHTFLSLPTVYDSGAYIITGWLYGCDAGDTVNVKIMHVLGTVDANANDPICANDTLKLHGTFIGQPVSCTWKGPNGFAGTAADTNVLRPGIMLSGQYIFTGYFKGCSYADTVTVAIKPSPADPVIPGDTVLCDGDGLALKGNNITPGASYEWIDPYDGRIATDSLFIEHVVPSQAGRYVFVTELNGCKTRDSLIVTVRPAPLAPEVRTNSPLKIGDVLKLEILQPEKDVTYKWTGPDGFKSDLLAPVIYNITGRNAGTYTATATLGSCTTATLEIVVIDGFLDTAGVMVFPNANNGDFTIQAFVRFDQNIPIVLSTATGQLVYSTTVQSQNKLLFHKIHLHDAIASGIYTLNITIAGRKYAVRVVVVRQ